LHRWGDPNSALLLAAARLFFVLSVGWLFSPWLEAHCATATLNRQYVNLGCEIGLKRFARLW
jgi:hypothetical protein